MEHLDVLVVGAGLSGIAAGHHLRTTCRWATYAVFEARDAIGGTWDLFRYPGIRSDSDMYTLGYPFRPWTEPTAIADGDAILDYIEDTAADEGIDRHIRFRHRVVRCGLVRDEARWHVTAERGSADSRAARPSSSPARFLFSCTGYYRYDHGYLPDFEGMDRFAGTIVHPQHWPEDLDYEGKASWSSAAAPRRSPSCRRWRGPPATSPCCSAHRPTWWPALAATASRTLPNRWLPPRVRGPGDPVDGTPWAARRFYRFCQRFPNLAGRMLRRGVERAAARGLRRRPALRAHLRPVGPAGVPGPRRGHLPGHPQGEASVVTDHIDTFTENGLLLDVRRGARPPTSSSPPPDSSSCSSAASSCPWTARRSTSPQRLTYKGMMLEGVPNLAMAVGYTNAPGPCKCDLTCDAVARLLDEMRDPTPRRGHPGQRRRVASRHEPLLGPAARATCSRAVDRLPRQGSRDPWRVRQSYVADYRSMKRKDRPRRGLGSPIR